MVLLVHTVSADNDDENTHLPAFFDQVCVQLVIRRPNSNKGSMHHKSIVHYVHHRSGAHEVVITAAKGPVAQPEPGAQPDGVGAKESEAEGDAEDGGGEFLGLENVGQVFGGYSGHDSFCACGQVQSKTSVE